MKRSKPIKRSEHTEQVVVMQWAAMNAGRWPCLRWLYAVPNGGHRHAAVAVKLRAEGVRPGVSDLCLPYASCGYHGLYIEMKAVGGALQDSQAEFLEYVNAEGYLGVVCWGADQAIELIENYLEGRI